MNPGPAGIAQLEYLFSRVICTSVPIGYIALLVILIIAGIKYLTSGGEPKAISSAHQTVTWGLLGVIFLAIAWLILQLIQNFTGIQVTKFTLSSLPGVQGFTGSCWEEAPVSPNIPPPVTNFNNSSIPNSSSNSTNSTIQNVKPEEILSAFACKPDEDGWLSGFPYKAILCYAKCGDSRELLTPYKDAHFTSVVYSSGSIDELGKAIDKPKLVDIVTELKIDNLWVLKKGYIGFEVYSSSKVSDPVGIGLGYSLPAELSPISLARDVIARGTGLDNRSVQGKLFIKYPKGVVPKDFIDALFEAQQLGKRAAKDYFDQSATDYELNQMFDEVDVGVLSCNDGDYYRIMVVSPLIYAYNSSSSIPYAKIKINSPVVSSYAVDRKGFWNLRIKDTTLSTSYAPSQFIPYEFLRRDFRRPENGIVVSADKLVEYLRSNLWENLGLTDTEIEDYWQDIGWRIPKANYYFISLIDRSEIDRVLPMEVDPKPDTIIRNMTYILPLSSPFIPIPLPEDKLKAPERNGFTVLENGGFIDGF